MGRGNSDQAQELVSPRSPEQDLKREEMEIRSQLFPLNSEAIWGWSEKIKKQITSFKEDSSQMAKDIDEDNLYNLHSFIRSIRERYGSLVIPRLISLEGEARNNGSDAGIADQLHSLILDPLQALTYLEKSLGNSVPGRGPERSWLARFDSLLHELEEAVDAALTQAL
jgi:hypothetical protein